MKTKTYNKWLIPDRLWVQLAIAGELWSVATHRGQIQTQLIFVGWYKNPHKMGRIFTINILGLSFKVGYVRRTK